MLHEILFGLLGHGIFAQSTRKNELRESQVGDSDEEGEIETVKDMEFMVPHVLSVAEAGLIEEITVSGAYYKEIGEFVKVHGKFSMDESGAASHISTIMLRALCDGLRELLKWHQDKVCSIEQVILKEGTIPLSRIKYLAADSSIVLRSITKITRQIESKSLIGGQIVELVYKRMARTGAAVIKERLERLLFFCNKVFFNMIEAWMAHGILIDRSGEFFVQQRPYKVEIPREDDGGVSFRSSVEMKEFQGQQHPVLAEYEWKSQFRLRLQMLPTSFFSIDLAEKVLFAGKANRVLQRSTFIRQQKSGWANHNSCSDSKDKENYDDNSCTYEEKDSYLLFSQVIGEARRQPKLDVHKIGHAIRRFYFDIARRLQYLVVTQSRLVDHLNFVRDFFLLGRGEFFTSFIDVGHNLLSVPPRPSLSQAEAAVNNGPWREASIQSGIDNWPEFVVERFSKLSLALNRSLIDFRNGFWVGSSQSGNLIGVPSNSKSKVATSVGGSESRGKSHTRRTVRNPSFASVESSMRSVTSYSTSVTSPVSPPGVSDKSKVSDLVLVGDSIVEDGVISISSPLGGGFWHSKKVVLERGWSTELSFRHSQQSTADSENSHFVAFCIQHDPTVGPTALGSSNGGLYVGLRNSLSFVVHFSPLFKTLLLQIESEEGVSAAEEVELTHLDLATSDEGYLDHTLRIEYKIEGEDRVHFVARVQLVDSIGQLIAEHKSQLDIGTKMQLETGSGRAWAGVLAGKRAVQSSASGELSCCVEISKWFFQSDIAGEKSEEHDPWRAFLTLETDVEWPLHLILTQVTIDQYGMLFRFLLCLKRVEGSLKETWAILNQTRFKTGSSDPARQRRLMILWRLRSSMAYLVNNLQFHLHVDVIDSLQKELVENIEHAQDFSVVAQAHSKFMEQLISRSFLHNKVIRSTVDTVLRRCLRFCSFVQKFSRYEQLPRTEERERLLVELDTSITEIGTSFSRDSTFLFALLTRINSNLLLRIDYNSHFSKLAKGEMNYRYNV